METIIFKDEKWVKYNGKWYDPTQWKNHERRKQIHYVPDECYHNIDKVLKEAEEKILTATGEQREDYLQRYFAFARRVREYNRERIIELERRKYRR